MEMKATDALLKATEAQRQLDVAAKRQVGKPFLSSATGVPLTYIVDRLRILEVAVVGGDLVTTKGAIMHTILQGTIVLADFVAARKAVEDSVHTEKLALQVDITKARSSLAAEQMELPIENV